LLFVAVVLFLAQHFIVVAVAVAVVVFTVGLHLFALIRVNCGMSKRQLFAFQSPPTYATFMER